MRNIGLLLVIIVVGSLVWYFVKGRVTGAGATARSKALDAKDAARSASASRTAKGVEQLARTLTLHTDPHTAGELIAKVAASDDRVTDVRPEEGVVRVEIDGSRPLVRAHLRPDRTVVGVDEYEVEMGFAQGAGVWDRVLSTLVEAARSMDVETAEGRREFDRVERPGRVELWSVRP